MNHSQALLFSLAAPAKLNLSLHVIGRRDDGYHLLDSVVTFLELHDRMDVHASDKDGLTLQGRFANALSETRMEDNLVMRAIRLLRDIGADIPPLHVVLTKEIPSQAGLGGGSSDAAAMLRGLMAHFGCHLVPDDARMLSLRLGADVPVCMEARPSLMQGIGEMVLPVTMPSTPLWVVLAHPGVMLSTPAVFARMRLPQQLPPSIGAAPFEAPSWDEWFAWLAQARNDLEQPAAELAPVMCDLLQAMKGTDGCRLARMTGSGSCCFALFETEELAESAFRTLQAAFPDAWVCPTRVK
ncbi:4-(cytidine 5'-diphospho)-2-C-methyl-D-erythritol kinase [bacterium]|nr:4-(cytidine 5'-diphospho)-2-C-methyl-D-erythritol kinase [bacterium]